MCGLSGEAGGSADYYYDFYRYETRKIRKSRTCEVCRIEIPARHFAHAYTTSGDGSVDTIYLHLQCRDLVRRVFDESDCEALNFRTLLDDITHTDNKEEIAKHIAAVRWAHGDEWRVND